MRYPQRNNRSGFTLIELLVVISIIAILVALVFPALSSALSRANTTKCSSNLHQIGVAMLAFAGDNNANLPASGGVITYNQASPDPNSGQLGWCQQLEPYVGMGQGQGGPGSIFQCPDSGHSIPANANYGYFNGAHAAYSANGGITHNGVNLLKMTALSRHIIGGDVAFPAALGESLSQGLTDADKDDMTGDVAFGGGTPSAPTTIPIHRGQSNILFADGHVEALRYFDKTLETTVYGNNNSTYTTP